MRNYSIITEIENFLNEKELDIDSVVGGTSIPKNLKAKKKKPGEKFKHDDLLNSVEEDEDQIEDDQEEEESEEESDSDSEEEKPDLTGNLEEEDIIMPNDLDPENGNVGEEFVRRFNILRATKSLKDKEVYNDFKKYYKSLSYEERIAFYTFIVGMSQVCTNSLGDDEEGSKPSDYGISISYKNKSESGKDDENQSNDVEKDDESKKKKEEEEPSRFQKKSKGIISVINTEGVQDKTEILNFLKKING
jgi:hypothetical protein